MAGLRETLANLVRASSSTPVGAALQGLIGFEPGLGLRPQSDEAVATLKQALTAGGESARTVQAALRAPGTMAVHQGPSGGRFDRANQEGSFTGGVTRPNLFGSRIDLFPDQLELMRQHEATGGISRGTVASVPPHELIHGIRFNRGLDTGDVNLEESIPRFGLKRPMLEWLNRQFGGGTQPMTLDDMERIRQAYEATLAR